MFSLTYAIWRGGLDARHIWIPPISVALSSQRKNKLNPLKILFKMNLCKFQDAIISHSFCRRPRFDSWVGKIPWRKKWQSTPVFFPGKSHEQRSLMGYSPWGCKDLDMTEHTCIRCLSLNLGDGKHVHAGTQGTLEERKVWGPRPVPLQVPSLVLLLSSTGALIPQARLAWA